MATVALCLLTQNYSHVCDLIRLLYPLQVVLLVKSYEPEITLYKSASKIRGFLSSWRIIDQLDVTCYFISLLMCSHVSDINISIIRSLRLFCWTTTLVVLFLVRCVLEFRCGWVGVVSVLQAPIQPHQNSNTHRTKNNTTNVVIQQNSRKLLMMDILMSETCRAYKKWNKIASDITLVFYSSTITMMHSPININFLSKLLVKILFQNCITICPWL